MSVEPDARHYSASIMKLPILIAVHRLVERGALDLARPTRVHDEFASQLPGHTWAIDRRRTPTRPRGRRWAPTCPWADWWSGW